MRRIFCTLLFCFVVAVPLALAQSALAQNPQLVSDLSRLYTAPRENWPEQTAPINQAGSELRINYSSDATLTIKISYPFETTDGGVSYNPLHTLVLYDVPAGEQKDLIIDLTRSPAWSPARDEYLLQVQGVAGSTVLIHEMDVIASSTMNTIVAAARHFFIDEPVVLSSVNYLRGYRILDRSFSVLAGVMMILVLLVVSCWSFVFKRNKVRWRTVICIPLVAFLIYDARFSYDLLRISTGDARSWFAAGEYRQLGPIPAIAESLQEEAKKDGSMGIEICSDGADFAQKQLRYMLYPIPVRRAGQEWSEATHLVLIDTTKVPDEGDMIDCGSGPKRVKHLSSFAHGAALFRYPSIAE